MQNKEMLKDIAILYAEDEDDVRAFTSRTLSGLVKDIKEAVNGVEGLKLFQEHYDNPDLKKFDVIVTDINMPKMGGLDMIEEIHKIDSTVPSVVTTAHNDAVFLKKAIDLGVRGYAMKPMNLFQLLESISRAVEPRILRNKLEDTNKMLEKQVQERTVELQETVKQLKINSKKLLYEATHDHLTGLANRQKLTSELDKEIIRESRYHHSFSIIMFDVDNFKIINDNYGHDIGDEVLVNLSNLSKEGIRSTDTLARWGGEEFIILLPETSSKNAIEIAEKIREDIDKADLTRNTKYCNITASFGVSTLKSDDTKQTLLKRVDDALYEAKHKGKNIVVMK